MLRIIAVCASVGVAALTGTADAAKLDAPKNPTYSKDVAPILNANCVQCHRPGEIGPMSLLSYDEVRPWAKSIAQYVEQRVMPPWHANPEYGTFANDRSLSEKEVATIVRWVKQGAKRGNPEDLPPLPQFPDAGWRLGEPDVVVTFDEVELAAGGADQFHDLVGDLTFEEDKWLRAVEILPSNRKVAHHVIIYQGDENGNTISDGWIGAWAAGTEPMVFPEGTGRMVKAGARLVADMHYHPADTPEKDQTRIGLHFADPDKVEKELVNLWILNQSFEIPAGAPDHEGRASYTFDQDSIIHGLLPHLHYRGKDFKYVATYPDGNKETLLQVDDYDFNWQTLYKLAEPKQIPAGTRIDCIAHWDNSANNPDNPDPTKTVRFGNESYDEMLIGFVDYVVAEGMRPATLDEQIASRLKRLDEEHPGDVYDVKLIDEDFEAPAVLYLPKEGPGRFDVGAQGRIFEGHMNEITWNEDAFEAKMIVQGLGPGTLSGRINAAAKTVDSTFGVMGQEFVVRGELVQ